MAEAEGSKEPVTPELNGIVEKRINTLRKRISGYLNTDVPDDGDGDSLEGQIAKIDATLQNADAVLAGDEVGKGKLDDSNKHDDITDRNNDAKSEDNADDYDEVGDYVSRKGKADTHIIDIDDIIRQDRNNVQKCEDGSEKEDLTKEKDVESEEMDSQTVKLVLEEESLPSPPDSIPEVREERFCDVTIERALDNMAKLNAVEYNAADKLSDEWTSESYNVKLNSKSSKAF